MSTTSLATAAGNARQRLANALAALQSDSNVPGSVMDIAAGLARAMGPLFQLESGSEQYDLFTTARGVLQETLEKMQTVEGTHPGVESATAAIAQSLGIIFGAIRESAAASAPAPAPVAAPAPVSTASSITQQMPATPAPIAAPVSSTSSVTQQMPATPAPYAMPPSSASSVTQQLPATPAPVAAPIAAPIATPEPLAAPAPIVGPAVPPQPVVPAAVSSPALKPPSAPSSHIHKAVAPPSATQTGPHSIPLGQRGLPRLETEVGVHTESNFFTDFLGDLRSEGGIFVATYHSLPVGSRCEVFVTFPGNLTADLVCTVKWKREHTGAVSPGLGVTINEAAPDAWNLIERFVRKREPIVHEV